MTRTRRRMLWIGAALATLPASVLLAEESKLFSHQLHLGDVGAVCADCHDLAAAGRPGLKTDTCKNCHDPTPAWRLSGQARPLAIKFPHAAHVAGLECKQCHAGVPEDKIADGAPVVDQAGCASCHAEVGVTVDERVCRACHGVDSRQIVPRDHRAAWLARHGREARWRVFEDHGRDCQLCHRADACVACHGERQPRDHSALWRVRMHGEAASWDRDRCKTCHETGVCERCHQTSEPVSHRGAWRQNHGFVASGFGGKCTVCHQKAWCISCHRGGGR